jgi:hypothetical protein
VARMERGVVFWLNQIEHVKVVMPARGKRLSLLSFAAALGIFAGYSVPGAAGWSYGAPAVLVLALIAGVSVLWSP